MRMGMSIAGYGNEDAHGKRDTEEDME